jgi:tetratricopeptide (TPR) repeat protein
VGKIGRNEPCPCGSGKKYKKCCMNKPAPVQTGLKHYLGNFWRYEKVNEMNTEEIIEKLQSMGIAFKEEVFLQDIKKFYSAEQLSENWFKTFRVTAAGRDEDFPWVAAWVLWERLAPKDILSTEQMSNLIDKGYDYLNENDTKAACDAWLEVWKAIKVRIRPEDKDIGCLDKQYKGSFFIANFCQDLADELHGAGVKDPAYSEKCIAYCNEFCNCFPNEDELILHNMKRSIADAYIQLKKIDEAKRELDKLINDYPNNPWSYIAYGDMYWLESNVEKDAGKAKEYYQRALLYAKDEYDQMAIEERLEDIGD